ncbi:MAG: hypothetical protein JNL58_05095 [Planctomyces sp.]|nr:hypothetical protein [Planctomyces sp.]
MRLTTLLLFLLSFGISTGILEQMFHLPKDDQTCPPPAQAKFEGGESEEAEKSDDSLDSLVFCSPTHTFFATSFHQDSDFGELYTQRSGEESHFCRPPPLL